MQQEIALRAALENREKFGKANEKAVIGKLLQLVPELRGNREEAVKIAEEAVKEANSLSEEDATRRLKELPELKLEKKEKKELGLPNVNGNVIMRFEPSPSGPMHIGHAYPLLLNKILAEKHKGKLILRISDTNPENIYPPAYELLPEDARWITEGFVEESTVQSDRMPLYYEKAEKALEAGYCYVCNCNPDNFRKLVNNKEACPCRDLSPAENLARWEQMLDNAPQGSFVVRVKTDLSHPNPAMRDWPALRINESKHPRQEEKYRVWPLLNWAVAIDDQEMKISHTLRAKDHMDNAKRQKYLLDHFEWKDPEHVFVGKINFTGLKLSTSQTRTKIEEGEYSDWDDIRLPFLPALRKRGYQPKAFEKWAKEMGITQNDKSVSKEEFFKALNAFNKEIIDETSNRYFYVRKPKEIIIKGAPSSQCSMPLHPDFPDRGKREFKTGSKYLMQEEDYEKLEEGKLYRFMDCLNFVKKEEELTFHSFEYEKYKEKGKAIMHWLPVENKLMDIKLRMPDGTLEEGKGEASLSMVKEGEIVQFERIGFCRLESKERNEFWYAHK